MKKTKKTKATMDFHTRIPIPLGVKFVTEAEKLGRKITKHFEMILEERYNK